MLCDATQRNALRSDINLPYTFDINLMRTILIYRIHLIRVARQPTVLLCFGENPVRMHMTNTSYICIHTGLNLIKPAAISQAPSAHSPATCSAPTAVSTTHTTPSRSRPSSTVSQDQCKYETLKDQFETLQRRMEALEASGVKNTDRRGGEGERGAVQAEIGKLYRDMMSIRANEKRLEIRLAKTLDDVAALRTQVAKLGG